MFYLTKDDARRLCIAGLSAVIGQLKNNFQGTLSLIPIFSSVPVATADAVDMSAVVCLQNSQFFKSAVIKITYLLI